MAEANPFSVIQFIAEQRIAEAQAQGVFDNLPGTGRPLELEDMSHVPEELRMAYKILSNAGCLPPELEQRKELNRLVDLLGSNVLTVIFGPKPSQILSISVLLLITLLVIASPRPVPPVSRDLALSTR